MWQGITGFLSHWRQAAGDVGRLPVARSALPVRQPEEAVPGRLPPGQGFHLVSTGLSLGWGGVSTFDCGVCVSPVVGLGTLAEATSSCPEFPPHGEADTLLSAWLTTGTHLLGQARAQEGEKWGHSPCAWAQRAPYQCTCLKPSWPRRLGSWKTVGCFI